jgi:hypothetical protein
MNLRTWIVKFMKAYPTPDYPGGFMIVTQKGKKVFVARSFFETDDQLMARVILKSLDKD